MDSEIKFSNPDPYIVLRFDSTKNGMYELSCFFHYRVFFQLMDSGQTGVILHHAVRPVVEGIIVETDHVQNQNRNMGDNNVLETTIKLKIAILSHVLVSNANL